MTDAWQGKRVTVTGASGFLGRHVVRAFHGQGAQVLQISRATGFDLRREDHARTAFYDDPPVDVVVHLAAHVGGIGQNRALSGSMIRDNLLINTNVLHACMMAGVEKVVTVGSVCAYPATTPTPFREHNLFDGYPEATNAPYGIAKRAMLVMGQAYRQQFGLNVIHVMPTNLYGPGDDFSLDHSHVIPAMMRKMHEAKVKGFAPVTLWGSGAASREFLYVKDAAAAIVCCAEKYNAPEPINIGSYSETRIDQLAGLLVHITGYTGDIIWDKSQPDGQARRTLDIRKIIQLGWSPAMHIEAGLHKTYDWYLGELARV